MSAGLLCRWTKSLYDDDDDEAEIRYLITTSGSRLPLAVTLAS